MKDIQRITKDFVISFSQLSYVYHLNSLKHAKTATEFWLMYALNDGNTYSQKELCDKWLFPKTTLNSCAKKCEAAGYLTLQPIPGKRREMHMHLTEKGKAYAEKMLEITYRAENKAMEETIARYSDEFPSAFEFYRYSLERAYKEEFEAHALNTENLDEKE